VWICRLGFTKIQKVSGHNQHTFFEYVYQTATSFGPNLGSRGLQAMPELLDLYATLLDFTCHYTSDSVCVYIFILALLYLRLLKILPFIRTVDIYMKLVCVSLFLIISCYMKDFCFQENLCQRNAAEKKGRKKNQNKESSEAPVSNNNVPYL
jgi:hypothetical protein